MKILLTGDDGYNSIGTRLVARALKDEHEIKIAGTFEQQSGMGGRINLRGKRKFKHTQVDGVEALAIDGSPVDAVEGAFAYFKERYDLIVSGMNFGQNIGGSLISSGTFGAAFRGIISNITKRAIAVSWSVPAELFFQDHAKNGDAFPDYVDYPGRLVGNALKHAIENDLYGANTLNINLPQKHNGKAKFVKPLDDLYLFYTQEMIFDEESGLCYYNDNDGNIKDLKNDPEFDTSALEEGFVTIQPCIDSFLHEGLYEENKGREFKL